MSKDETTSTALAVRSSSNLEALADLRRALLEMESPAEVVDDPEEIQREIVAEILASQTKDEVFNRGEVVGLRELCRRWVSHNGLQPQAGVPLELHSFKWRPSDYANAEGSRSAPIYLVVRATRLDTGEAIVTTTGSMTIMAQLIVAAERGFLDGAVVLATETEKPTRGNYYPMALVPVPQAMREKLPPAVAEEKSGAEG